MLVRVARSLFSKIKKQEIVGKSYTELADLVAHKYSSKQSINSNAICFTEIQQRHRIINPGDLVLDIGAGPNFTWTDLALKFSEDIGRKNFVISNDLIEASTRATNHSYIRGNFLNEPVRTNIALKLGARRANTIIVDASPQFTGVLDDDAASLAQLINQAMFFSNTFLEKGGNFVCKILAGQSSRLIEQTAKLFFHQFFVFKPSILRPKSPVKFFVMKGFAMNHELEAMNEFLFRYRGSAKNKTQVVQSYQGKYSWNPIQIIRDKAKNDILGFKFAGKSDKQIQSIFSNDPFVRVNDILKQIRVLESARQKKDGVALKKAVNKFTQGKLQKQSIKIPSSRQQWINYLEKMQQQIQQLRSKKEKKKENIRNLQPLQEGEVYMKNENRSSEQQQFFFYIEDDLLGNYDISFEKATIDQEIAKAISANPDLQDHLMKKGSKGQDRTLQKVFSRQEMELQQTEVKKKKSDLAEVFAALTDEDFKALMDKQGYQNEIEENIPHKDHSKRQKFRNR